ncbi:MAG: hypothetical protein ACOX4I_04260 [Anaerovoracaceae bacterium]
MKTRVKLRLLNVALNKITGAWNEELLADLLVDLQKEDFNLDLTGFEPPEVEQLFSKIHNKDIKEDDFDVDEELRKPTKAKLGDLWLNGRHRVVCGDSTLPETYTKIMDGKKANLVVTILHITLMLKKLPVRFKTITCLIKIFTIFSLQLL